jgi:2-polyprenyl-3-methyl-5-hydroxy-6-metoxy-1,4-benzoquinol methylase
VSFSEYHEELWEAIPAGREPEHLAVRLAFLLQHTDAGETVLDVGCGEGRFASELARAGAHVIGIDVANEPLRRAAAAHPDLQLRLVAPAGPWPFDDASFDVVWAGEVIEHVHDTARWLSEIRRVLRPGGRLLLSTPAHPLLHRLGLALSPRAFQRHFDPLSDHLRFYTNGTLRRLLEEFGMREIEIHDGGGPFPGARRLLLSSARRARF